MLLTLLIVLKVVFALKVNIEYMSIKQAFSLFFCVQSVSQHH
jgi:hypothetical protein